MHIIQQQRCAFISSRSHAHSRIEQFLALIVGLHTLCLLDVKRCAFIQLSGKLSKNYFSGNGSDGLAKLVLGCSWDFLFLKFILANIFSVIYIHLPGF